MTLQQKLWTVLIPLLLLTTATSRGAADEKSVVEQLKQSRKRFATADSWAKRRSELRREFLKGAGLWPLPKRPPVKAIVHGRREYKGYSVENVALETLPGFYCTGNLYRPLGRKKLGPAILCPHGHFRPLGRFRANHQMRCAHFARMGATVFSYSMVGWQDSQQTRHQDPLVLALQTWNSIRVVDYLSGLERVDVNRIGVTGASGGGTQTFFLALVDERIKVSAPLVIVYPWSAPQGCLCEGGLPVMQAANTNAIELAAATAPRPQLLISVGNDPTQNFPKVGFPFIKHMYGVAGAGKLVKNVHLANQAHDFGPTKRKLVYEFFARHLHMTGEPFLAGGLKTAAIVEEDPTGIVIEPPDRLEVFNANHPLPKNAVRGSRAIARAFRQHLTSLRRNTAPKPGRTPTPANTRVQTARPAEYSFQAAGAADETQLCDGSANVGVPADTVRIEVWKGFEYRPATLTIQLPPGQTRQVTLPGPAEPD